MTEKTELLSKMYKKIKAEKRIPAFSRNINNYN